MWAQYGEGHKGVCLVFDRRRLVASLGDLAREQNRQFFYGDVNYADIPSSILRKGADPYSIDLDLAERLGVSTFVRQHTVRYWRELYFLKHRDWQTENEYRVMLSNRDEDYVFVSILGSLVGVAFGEEFGFDASNKYAEEFERNGIRGCLLHWKGHQPEPHPLMSSNGWVF
ncbi:DUF2971 domain-containing protein [Aliiroseovarius sp.]|uniref:DUF2971 domain-containing protein n=1 Tax=Aliiroseovarius sp. TaxID=1872442 RepID=UPI003BAC25B1